MELYEIKVKYMKLNEKSGKQTRVTECYLIDAVTFGEAEEKAHKAMESVINGEFTVKAIAKSTISAVYASEQGEHFFKCKIKYKDVDPDSGKEQKITSYALVMADDAKQAYERCVENLRMIIPYDIPSVTLSPIVDVIPE